MNRPPWINLSVVLLLAAVVFAPALRATISVWDDEIHLSRNPAVRSLDWQNVRRIFHGEVCRTYIPLTILSFAVEYQFYKDRPFFYHLDNLLLHFVVVALAFWLGLRLGLTAGGATLAALLFGVHPMHVESVAWVSERKDLLYSVFYLAALTQYVNYTAGNKLRCLALTILLGLSAMLAKPMALSLPLILFLLDWYLGRRFGLRLIYEKLPHFLYVLPIAWITFCLNLDAAAVKLPDGILIWMWSSVFPLVKFFAPVTLLPTYGIPLPVTISNPVYGGSILLAAVLVFLFYRLRRHRLAVFAFLYYFLSLFFLFRFREDAGANPVADRFMYLPSLGVCFLVGQGLANFLFQKGTKGRFRAGLPPALVTLLFLLLGTKTLFQSRIWQDDFTMWEYVVRKSPANYRAHFGIGQAYFKRQDPALALQHYQEALRLKPDDARSHNNIGDILYSRGETAEATAHFRRAVNYDPDYAEAFNNYGVALMEQGRLGEARFYLEEAGRLEPAAAIYSLGRGDYYLRTGDLTKAREVYSRALEGEPDNAVLVNRLGAVALRDGAVDAAIGYFKQALQLNPGYRPAHDNLIKAIDEKRKLIRQGKE